MSRRSPLTPIGWRAIRRAGRVEPTIGATALAWFASGAAWGIAAGIIIAGLLR